MEEKRSDLAALLVIAALASATPALAGETGSLMRLDGASLDRVVAGATFGIEGDAQASADGSLSSNARADLDLSAATDGNGATARGTALAMGMGVGDAPSASSSADVQVSGPFDRVFRVDIRRRFGGRWFVVDYSYVSVQAVKLPN